jgi:3-oxoacyl-[acyl-carrier-protein] synthase II
VLNMPCIVGWSALSPVGKSRRSFAEAVCAGRTGRLTAVAGGGACTGYAIEGSDAAAFIGTQGSRTVDRMTSMVIAVTTEILHEIGDLDDAERAGIGLVLGTSTGSVHSITEFLRDTFTQAKPFFVNPANFPNTVMNGAAGRTAIWHGLRGLNSTVAGGHASGLAALRYATRMIQRGYARMLLVGAVEELSPPIAWAASRIRQQSQTPLGEGCAMFLLESSTAALARGRKQLAGVQGFASVTIDPQLGQQVQSQRLATAIREVMHSAGVHASELWAVSMAQSGDGVLDEIEVAGVQEALGDAPARRFVASHHVGNTFSALGAFQVASLLAIADNEPAAALSRPALCTSVGVDGAITCALLRL